MADETRPVLELWDRVIDLAEQARPADWSRPTPDPDMSVRDVVVHVAAGAPLLGRSPAELLDGLRLAREAYVARTVATPQGDPGRDERALGASCLDLYVHAHDVASALGVPVDLDEDSPAVRAAAEYLLRLAPRLFELRAGARHGDAVRLGLGDEETTAGLWHPGGAEGVVTATPAAFVLLLAGRGDPGQWRARGALDWSGAAGEAFVQRARLYA
jgi:hypothetical protein